MPAVGVDPTPGFNNKIPDKLMTPDAVETRLGTLKFVNGVPTAETAQMVYDNLDFVRGVEVFLNLMPAAVVDAIRSGNAELGASKSNQAVIFDNLLDSSPLLLTGNTDTVYLLALLDLEVDGPTVIEVPPGSGPGTVNDAFFRFVVDMGVPGLDQGKGGKYLIVPADFKGEVAKDKKDGGEYFVVQSPSHVNILFLRGFLVDGKPDASSKMFREGVKIYSLSKVAIRRRWNSSMVLTCRTIRSTLTISSSMRKLIASSKRSRSNSSIPNCAGLPPVSGSARARSSRPTHE